MAYGDGVRFYSLHRAYGLTPDPAPIPPQFFASTPDLADPPGPQGVRLASGTGTAAQREARATEANTGSDVTSGQQ